MSFPGSQEGARKTEIVLKVNYWPQVFQQYWLELLKLRLQLERAGLLPRQNRSA